MLKIQNFIAVVPMQILRISVFAALLTGCAVKLAPDYDKSIVDGLIKANVETLTLMAGISKGADKATFTDREEIYNKIIGQFDALLAQVAARPEPRSLVAEWFGLGTTSAKSRNDIAGIKRLKAPSEEILLEIVSTLSRMRDTDRKGTLDENKMTGDGGFPNSYKISFQQVFTYEKALER